MARAIYKKADIYLLDDPISSVDLSVGRNILSQCIQSFLSTKLVVLVTNQTQFVQNIKSAEVHMMSNGSLLTISDKESIAKNLHSIHAKNDVEGSVQMEMGTVNLSCQENRCLHDNDQANSFDNCNKTVCMTNKICSLMEICRMKYLCTAIMVMLVVYLVAIVSYEVIFLKWYFHK